MATTLLTSWWDWLSSWARATPISSDGIESGGLTGSALFAADLLQLAYEHTASLTGSAVEYITLVDPMDQLFDTEIPVCHREEVCQEECYACEQTQATIETFERLDL